MASHKETQEITPLKSLFELLALGWMALWFFGPLAGIALWGFKYALPKAIAVFNYVQANSSPHRFPVEVLIAHISFGVLVTLPFLLYIGLIQYRPLQEFIVKVAEFLWDAPFLNREFWTRSKKS